MNDRLTIHAGDALEILRTLSGESVHCCVTSPPYFGLRDYQVEGQIGLESTPEAYVARLVEVFRELRRVLRDDGTCWVNLGDSFAASGVSGLSTKGDSSTLIGSANAAHLTRRKIVPNGLKPKDLTGIPWMVAFALRADGWYLRSDIIWSKPNPMPESVTDRPTKAHEYLFLLSKNSRYYYDAEAIAEPSVTPGLKVGGNGKSWHDHKNDLLQGDRKTAPGAKQHQAFDAGRNKRSVWTIPTSPYPEAHFATFPPALIEPCIRAGCPFGGIVLDPFAGSGTTGMVALENGRKAILIELNPDYLPLIQARCNVTPAFL